MARRESTLCGCSFPVIENFVFERSSGYAGYRCNCCGHWVYFNDFNIHFGFPLYS